MKKLLRALTISAVSAAALAMATPALAGPPAPGGTFLGGCSTTLTTPDAIDCDGYYSQNILNGSATDVALQQQAIENLGGSWDGDWTALVNAGNVITTLTNGNQLNFSQTMFGLTIIGAHYGNIPDPGASQGNVSVFWLFDFGSAGADYVTLDNTQGWSNAALYTSNPPGVPEPATWAMMIFGFGAAGVAMRRRRKQALISQLA
jgi:hypothetical protein